jgi:hypothetical protein
VIDGSERFDEAVFDGVQLLQREAAFFELPVQQALERDVVHQALEPRGRRIHERPARAFAGIGQHQNRGFLGLRLGAGIAEARFVHR